MDEYVRYLVEVNLRPISSVNQINKAISILKGKPKIRRTMWSRRAQEYDEYKKEI